MKAIRETTGELVVESRLNVKPLIAGGVLICAVGLLILTMTQTLVILDCRRTGPMEGNIELSTHTLLGSTTRRVALQAVTAVAIRESVSRGSGGVMLRTRDGEFSLAALSSGQAKPLAAKMTEFLSSPGTPNLTIRQDYRLSIYALGTGVALLGLLLLALTSQRVRCTLDGNAGNIVIERKSVFGSKRCEAPFSQVADLRAESVGPRGRAKVVYLILRSGGRIHAGWPDASNTVDRMRAFLGPGNTAAALAQKEIHR